MATVGLGSSEGKFPEYGGQFKQHCSSERTKVKGIVTTNACKDFQAEIMSNEELFDDDDDLIAAMADEDYFGNEEDFDMEQIDQLEQGMQDRSKTAATKRKTTCETETIEMDSFGVLCGDYEGDDVFEDDFITNGPPSEDEEGIEVKPLHQRICNKDRSRAIHQSKKAKTSATATTTNTTEFHDSSWKTSSSVSNNSNIQIQGELFANATRLTIPKVDSMLQMSNGLIETESSSKVTSLDCNAAPFMYLSDILKHLSVSQEYIVRVKAYIATIVSRSNPSSPNWNVIVKLNDGTGTVDADLSEKVLTELLEYPVDEFWREMQEAMKTRNTAVCQRLQKRSEVFQRNLASTSCLMDLQFSVDMPRPRVLHLSQTTSADVSAMLRRVSGLL